MPLRIEPYRAEHVPAVIRFNRRLALGGVAEEFRFPETAHSQWLPSPESGSSLCEEMFLAIDGEVRGGYILKWQDFRVDKEIRRIGYYHLPLSEGLVDKAWTSAGVNLLRDALSRSPLLYCLGMGGPERPLPRMLKVMGWRIQPVPFLFRICRARRVFRELPILQHPFLRRAAARLAALSGAGSLLMTTMQRTKRAASPASFSTKSFHGPWEDAIWREGCESYDLTAVRDSTVLNLLYGDTARFHILAIDAPDGRPSGWLVALDTIMRHSEHFGNLRVGSMIDNFAVPGMEQAVIRAGRTFLEQRGVDLIVSNQSHPAWIGACHNEGFLTGPSNFLLATSKQLSAITSDGNRFHFVRGDGDGPIHL